jgi:hypothetical protein
MSNFFCPVAFLILLAAGITDVTSAQTFGSPKEEQGRLASMSLDAEKLSKITDRLHDIQKQKLTSLDPIDLKRQSLVEKWKREEEALTSYIAMFNDIHGASIVLLSAVALSLQVTERHLSPFYLSSICTHMPGAGAQFNFLAKNSTKKGDIARFYVHIGEEVLERNEMNIALEGLQIAEQLAHSYNSLCKRVINPKNWNK